MGVRAVYDGELRGAVQVACTTTRQGGARSVLYKASRRHDNDFTPVLSTLLLSARYASSVAKQGDENNKTRTPLFHTPKSHLRDSEFFANLLPDRYLMILKSLIVPAAAV